MMTFSKSVSTRTILSIALMLMVTIAFGMPETVSAKAKPARVTGIKVTTTYNSATVKWKKAKGAKKYEIYRSVGGDDKFVKIKTVKKKTTKFKDKKLSTGQKYWYKVRAVRGKKKGSFSRAVLAAPRLKTPKLKVTSAGDGNRLSLSKSIKGASGYIFYRDGKKIKEKSGSSYTDASAQTDTPYIYEVIAYRNVHGKRVMSAWSNEKTASRPAISIEQVTAPSGQLYQGVAFTIKGKITSYCDISKVEVGVFNPDGTVPQDAEGNPLKSVITTITDYDTNKKLNGGNPREFRILKLADNDVKFGTLEEGSYIYRVTVTLTDGTQMVVVKKKFEIIIPYVTDGAKKIAAKGVELAWPYGTAKKKYKFKGGNPTAAYKAALNAAYPKRSKWSKKPRKGASCDVFVGTTIRASGYDVLFPRGLDEIEKHVKQYPNLWRETGITSISKMLPGDIVYQEWKTKSGGKWHSYGHVVVYLGNGKVANAHYGGGGKYGIIELAKNQIRTNTSNRKIKEYHVYRAVK